MVLGRSIMCRRKEERYPGQKPATAVVYHDEKRHEAEVVNESDSGIAVRIAEHIPFQSGNKVRIIFHGANVLAVITWVNHDDEGNTTVGMSAPR